MKVIIGSSVILMAMMATYVAQVIYSNNAAQAARDVRAPLTALDSVISSMMCSSNAIVFLNLGSIGEDENYLCFEPIEGGLSMRFPAYGTDRWSKRQGKHVERLKQVASSLSLPVEEKSKVAKDGSVDGVNFVFRVMGNPETVAETVKQFVTRTFGVSDSEECTFQYANMPSSLSVREGEHPTQISSDEFVREYERGMHVYLGEQENLIYIIPQELAGEESLYWDAKILYTNLRELPPDVPSQIRHPVSERQESSDADPMIGDRRRNER